MNGLSDYPRPSVAVDTALLTVAAATHRLSVVLVNAAGDWRLPGTFLHEGETLVEAVLRALRLKAGVTGVAPRQLRVFDDPDRDDRGWVLSVGHTDAVAASSLDLDASRALLVPVDELPPLAYDHDVIVRSAVRALRDDYRRSPDPAGLIAEPFSLRELRQLHEAVAGEPLARDTFRRTMQPQLIETGTRAHGGVGKPAQLFTRAKEQL